MGGEEEITEGDEEGGKGRFSGGGDRQSHRGSAPSLTGWGSSPRPQGKAMPSDSTTCHPLTTLPPLQAPRLSPPSPLPSTHSSPPASCTLLCTPAHLSPLPGLQFCTTLPSHCLAHCAFASSLRGPVRSPAHAQFPWHTVRLFPHAPHPLVSHSCLHTLSPGRPPFHPSLPKNLWALAADTLGTPFPSPSHRLCASPDTLTSILL